MQMAPAIGNSKNSDFVGAHAQALGNFFAHSRERKIAGRGAIRLKRRGELLQFGNQGFCHSRMRIFTESSGGTRGPCWGRCILK